MAICFVEGRIFPAVGSLHLLARILAKSGTILRAITKPSKFRDNIVWCVASTEFQFVVAYIRS